MSRLNLIDPDNLINDRYLPKGWIGAGGFGKILSALDKHNDDQLVAIKVATRLNLPAGKYSSFDYEREPRQNPLDPQESFPKEPTKMKMNRLLKTEYNVLKHVENIPGFPKVLDFGRVGDESYLVMELLGKTVDAVFREYNDEFSLKTILLILDQLLDRLRSLHGKGIIHGDLHTGNIMFGTGENTGLVHLIDFGLSSMYMDLETGKHLPDRKVRAPGATLFLSLHSHKDHQKSRRDDMESLAYIIAYLVNKGNLPWTEADNVEDSAKGPYFNATKKVNEVGVQIKKEEIRGIDLFGYVPREFAIFFERVRELKYDQWPDYVAYQNLFRRLGTILGVKYDDMSQLNFDKK